MVFFFFFYRNRNSRCVPPCVPFLQSEATWQPTCCTTGRMQSLLETCCTTRFSWPLAAVYLPSMFQSCTCNPCDLFQINVPHTGVLTGHQGAERKYEHTSLWLHYKCFLKLPISTTFSYVPYALVNCRQNHFAGIYHHCHTMSADLLKPKWFEVCQQ